MEQFSTNENVISENNETIERFMNVVILKDRSKENPSVRIEISRNPKHGNEKIMKANLHVQTKIWKPHGRTSLC
jgi:hypothetical protein